jgi:photosystem I P700 chlorophyll a apoprotein A2
MVKQEGAHPVSVEGHTDAIGTADYNQRFSLDRARAVKEWLVSHRFAPESTAIRGYGKDRPVAPNARPDGSDDPDGRRQNRRVDVVVDTCR